MVDDRVPGVGIDRERQFVCPVCGHSSTASRMPRCPNDGTAMEPSDRAKISERRQWIEDHRGK